MTALITTGHVAAAVWFVVAWAFLLAVLFKRWREREAADQAETDRQLDHWWDA